MVRIAGLIITSNVESTLTVSSIVRRGAQGTLTSLATLTSTPVKRIVNNAAFSSLVSVNAIIGVRKLFTVNISSALTFVVAIRELRLDAVVYVIPAEGWTYRIEGETRLHKILSESRVKEIVGETRLETINGESRIHII